MSIPDFEEDIATDTGAYALIVRALIVRNGGGVLRIEPHEVFDGVFSIGWRDTPDGGMEATLIDLDRTLQ